MSGNPSADQTKEVPPRLRQLLPPMPKLPDMSAMELDRAKFVLDAWKIDVEQWRFAVQAFQEAGKTGVEFSKLALGHLLLANGGAAVALLALLGHIASKETAASVIQAADFIAPLLCFSAGVALAFSASCLAYLSTVAGVLCPRLTLPAMYAAIGASFCSGVGFVVGAVLAGLGFRS